MQRRMKTVVVLFVLTLVLLSGCTAKRITFEKGNLPEGLPGNSTSPYYAVRTVGNNVYFVVHWGEKTTGGYGIDILSITQDRSGDVTVKTQLTSPDPNDFVTMAITNPYVAVIVNKKDLQIEKAKFNFVDKEGNALGFRNYDSLLKL